MYYQVHILIQEEDKIYRHIPLYFCTTQDREKAIGSFKAVCAQVFEFEKDVDVRGPYKRDSTGTIMSACGNVTSSFNHKGKYLVELTEWDFKPTNASII